MQPDTTVLGKVFDSFLEKLRTDNVSPAVIARLDDLLDKRQLRAESIKRALFADEDVP